MQEPEPALSCQWYLTDKPPADSTEKPSKLAQWLKDASPQGWTSVDVSCLDPWPVGAVVVCVSSVALDSPMLLESRLSKQWTMKNKDTNQERNGFVAWSCWPKGPSSVGLRVIRLRDCPTSFRTLGDNSHIWAMQTYNLRRGTKRRHMADDAQTTVPTSGNYITVAERARALLTRLDEVCFEMNSLRSEARELFHELLQLMPSHSVPSNASERSLEQPTEALFPTENTANDFILF